MLRSPKLTPFIYLKHNTITHTSPVRGRKAQSVLRIFIERRFILPALDRHQGMPGPLLGLPTCNNTGLKGICREYKDCRIISRQDGGHERIPRSWRCIAHGVQVHTHMGHTLEQKR